MIRSIVTAAAAIASSACMVGAATPAFAADTAPRMTFDARNQQFCTAREVMTGSLVPTAECHDATGWAVRGLTVRIAQR